MQTPKENFTTAQFDNKLKWEPATIEELVFLTRRHSHFGGLYGRINTMRHIVLTHPSIDEYMTKIEQINISTECDVLHKLLYYLDTLVPPTTDQKLYERFING